MVGWQPAKKEGEVGQGRHGQMHFLVLCFLMRFGDSEQNKNKPTKAAENVVEVVEIIIAFLQYSSVAIGDVDLSVGVSHCAGAGKKKTPTD